MKSKWSFFFETRGFRFGRRYEFLGKVNESNRDALSLPAGVDQFLVEMVPDPKCKSPKADESGVLNVTVTGTPESTKLGVWAIVSSVAQQISFKYRGDLKIHTGLILGERIAETEAERAEVEKSPHFGEARLIQWRPPTEFTPDSVESVSIGGEVSVTVAQYNAAKQASNAVDQFLGYFKVLESMYCDEGGRQNTLAKFRTSKELRALAVEIARRKGGSWSDDEHEAFLRQLVRVRGNCAHLRAGGKSGFLAGTIEVKSEVEPLAELLGRLAFMAIQCRLEPTVDTTSHPAQAATDVNSTDATSDSGMSAA